MVTGSAGLIGSEASRLLAGAGFRVIGIDNFLRGHFFGAGASTAGTGEALSRDLPRYRHETIDIRDAEAVGRLFAEEGTGVELVIHAAAQPSHDWAARDPATDFGINAQGTLVLLEAVRRWARDATFIFLSTNKVYGDQPNRLPLRELPTRFEVEAGHVYSRGIDESMGIDQCLHSLFGASKVAADVLVQEYGRYFQMNTACFRAGCLTGPTHAGTRMHGFLSYLMRCAVGGREYSVYGYRGKQVRDNLHSHDLVTALLAFHAAPRQGEVYNIGGGPDCGCSVLEGISMCQEIAGRELSWSYSEQARAGDHIWWITDTSKLESHYPSWRRRYGLAETLEQIRDSWLEKGTGE